MSDERCQRCEELGQDRRTLWMACLYQMDELPVPFKETAIRGQGVRKIGEHRLTGLVESSVPIWSDRDPEQDDSTFPFFLLRVCKDCRGDWMTAIRDWFNSVPDHFVTDSPDANIPVRIDGRVKMLTREQYDEFGKEK